MKKKRFQLFGKDSKSNNEEKEKPTEPEKVSYFELYRYASCIDKCFITFGSLLTVLVGLANPLMMIFFGDITGAFVDYAVVNQSPNNTESEKEIAANVFYEEIKWFLIYTSVLGILTVLFSYIATVLFHYTAQKQIFKIRTNYFESVLNQDIAWYDTHQTGDFIIRITEDLLKIQEGIGEKVSIFIYFLSIFLSGVILALVCGWELALICLISCPLSIGSMTFMSMVTTKFTKNEMESYGAAGAIAEEVFSSIKTVVAFEGQNKEHQRYKKHLIDVEKNNIKRSIFTAIGTGVMWFNIYAAIALSFWYGVKLILDEKHLPPDEINYTTSKMIAVFFATFSANWSFGQCAPYFDVFAAAQTAAYQIFKVIDTVPIINASKNNGIIPEKITGNISFNDVFFEYPSRSDVKILKGLNLKIKAGETIALVGSSGCGKSTCVQLVQRFYDPTSGTVTLDGNDISLLDLTWLRSHIGVVGQEPVLFATTIAENIKYGNKEATQSDIEEAAKQANAHTSITALPDGYNTLVGERGAQLSGGQKQRIAIARALVKSPAILLLDEATSALDTNSESIVQAAIDKVSKNSTTIIVAHRLSTVKDADRIIVLSEGVVVEEGTHKVLMELKGHYHNLVTRQTSESEFTDEDEKENDEEAQMEDNKITYDRQASFIDPKHLEDEDDEEDIKEISTVSSLKSVIRMNGPEWFHITLGCISSLLTGAALPVYSIFFGAMLGVLSSVDDDYVRSETAMYSLYFLLIGITSGIASFIQMHTFNIAGEKLTKRVRSEAFQSVLKQELGWFDCKENAVGALCARLSTDAAYVQGASGQPIGTVLNAISTLGLAIGFAISFEWRTALVTLCFTPLIFVSIYLEQKIVTSSFNKNNNPFESSSKLAVEAISNIRTVASLGCEKTFQDMYYTKLEEHFQKAKNGGHFQGFSLGMARGMMFFTYGISLFYGGTLVLYDGVDYSDIFKVSESLITGAWSMGTAIAYTPNFQKGIAASKKMLALISRMPAIRSPDDACHLKWSDGNINYSKVSFTYPTRRNVRVLKELDLNIQQGKTIALVGSSGCGKSTLIQLLQRFYDPKSGMIGLDDTNIQDITLHALRSNFGIVSQEPVLFDRTIEENIAYGNNNRRVTKHEIIEAAKNANIHNFIVALPQGYETRVGDKGTQLSGGQKQRMAIARALIRNPKVLLLDEATSALDTESEKVVQEALDNAKKDRTCITIAHRLTTIKDADQICVVNKGKIEEIGTHNELLQKKGLYYKLQMLQK